ncbi:Late embryogenesis abundant protein ECP63-like protein [Drosera capensis]
MAKRVGFLALWIVAAVAVGLCGPHDAAETMSAAAEVVKENAGAWTGWAANKLNEAWGSEDDDGSAQAMAGKVGEAASKSSESMNNIASESAEYASDKATQAANMASEHMGDAKEYLADKATQASNMASEHMGDAKEYLSDKATHASNMASEHMGDAKEYLSDKASDAKDAVHDAFSQGWDKAGDLFNLGVEKLGDAYPTVGDTMVREAKAKYESAKEKLSQATGDVGAAMRKEGAEL